MLRPIEIDDFDFRVKIGGKYCKQPYSCSVFNISAMSFSALSANASGRSAATFRCRTPDGNFDPQKFALQACEPQVKMIEPLQEALLLVHNTLTGLNLRDETRLGASGKIISTFDIARTMALGADRCNAARGFMFALGRIQSLSCHTGRCPTGDTTQEPWRQRALVPEDKATRVYNFHRNTLRALAELIGAAGLPHPGEIEPWHIVRSVSSNEIRLVANLYKFLIRVELLTNPKAHVVYEYYSPPVVVSIRNPATMRTSLSGASTR